MTGSKKIWVIGGGGQIGEGLRMKTWKDHVVFLKREDLDVLNPQSKIDFSCDTIVDLVPSPFVTNSSLTSADEYDKVYTIPHIDFMKNAITSGVKNYIFTSSGGAVYGNAPHGLNITEEYPTAPVSNYGKSKVILENSLLTLAEEFKCRTVILRPGSAFNANPESVRQRGLIGALLNCLKNDSEFNLYGSLQIAKDYISNEDIGSAIVGAVESDASGIFNVGTGHAYSIKEVIEMFESSFSKKLKLTEHDAINSDVAWYCLDSKKAGSSLEFKVKNNLPEWLQKISRNYK